MTNSTSFVYTYVEKKTNKKQLQQQKRESGRRKMIKNKGRQSTPREKWTEKTNAALYT